MNADGTGSRLVRRGAHNDVSWSPDGRMLLFTAVNTPVSARHAYVMTADGSGLRRVTKQCADDGDPSWSPDGRKIAISCIRTRPSRNYPDIYTVNVDGTSLRKLTELRHVPGVVARWSVDCLRGLSGRLRQRHLGDALRRLQPAARRSIHP
jgi:Tol biopolymer transport system component